MNAPILRAPQVRVDALVGETVAVLGFGAQGSAHALNLRDSGCRVRVAQRRGGPRFSAAVAAGFEPLEPREAARGARLIIFALADEAAPAVYREQVAPELRAGQTLGFIHGFNIHYRLIEPPADVDVVLVAPKAQGRAVRASVESGAGVPALVAVAQDATGRARDTALAWAAGIGCGRAGVIETTFAIETETDLFGEQAVLCGGLTALIRAGFEVLVEAGYPPEAAYFECCHELKLIVDLIHEGGVEFMRRRISSTARYGDLTRGKRVIGPAARDAMRRILAEIRSGQFAREFLAAGAPDGPTLRGLADAARCDALEEVGRRLRDALRPA